MKKAILSWPDTKVTVNITPQNLYINVSKNQFVLYTRIKPSEIEGLFLKFMVTNKYSTIDQHRFTKFIAVLQQADSWTKQIIILKSINIII